MQTLRTHSTRQYALSAIAIGALLLCLSLCLVSSDSSDADSSGTTGSLNWELTGSELTITGTGAMPNYTPTNYYPSNPVPWSTSITKVTIGEGVTSVGNYAFYDCTLLFSVSLPSTLKTIGECSFSGCSTIVDFTVPSGVTTIGAYAFSGCSSLNEIDLGTGVTTINQNAFSSCASLTSIVFPDSVTTLGSSVCYGCSGLTSVTLPNSLTTIPGSAFSSCSKLPTITIPNSVTTIQSSAFSNCSKLATVEFGTGLITIGSQAFYSSGLTSITIPDTVTTINERAFESCSKLLDVHVSKSLSTLGNRILGNDGYTNYLYSASGATLSPTANLLAGAHLIQYKYSTYQYGYKYIGGDSGDVSWSITDGVLTFEGTGATGYYGSATVLPWDNAYSKIVIDSGVTEIGSYVFKTPSNVTEAVISDSVTTIHTNAFSGFTFKDYDGTTIIDPTATYLKNHSFAGTSGILQLMRNGITVLYKFSDGSTASEDVYQSLTVGQPYNISSPTVTGYSPSSTAISGTLEKSSEWYVVTYTPNTYQLTIRYLRDGNSISPDSVSNVVFGQNYSVNSPNISGFTADITTVTGTMDAEGKTISVNYTPLSYNLTIYYKYDNGDTASATRIESVEYLSEYSFDSPVIDGYTASPATVSGTLSSPTAQSRTVYYYPPSYVLTLRCVDPEGNEIANAATYNVYFNKTYNVYPPSVTGYTTTTYNVTGTMDTEGKTVDVTYTPNNYTLTITYTQAATAAVFDTFTQSIAYNSEYHIESPMLPGYAANHPVVEGKMDALGKSINVVYTIKTFSLNVHYKYSDGSEASPTHCENVAYGSSFNVTSPTILGYVPDYNSISGVMGMHDLDYTVVYNNTFKITIVYVYADGSVAAEPYTATVGYGSTFDVSSPTLAGYTPDRSSISGMMGASNLDYKVTYASASSGGNGGGNGTSGSNDGGTTTILVGVIGVIAAISLILTAVMFIRRH